jgi:molecular chaperone Hsp33
MSDQLLRFAFDNIDVRGVIVQLEKSCSETVNTHHYPQPVKHLLGEFLAAATLLSATLKFDGVLILQAKSDGEIPLIMAEASSRRTLRGIARRAEEAHSHDFNVLLANGQLAITIDPVKGARYQGIVPLEGKNLATCLEGYFRQSEQLNTRIWLASDGQRAAGLLLQELPVDNREDKTGWLHDWQHLCTLADTLKADELVSVSPADLLYRLFHQDNYQIFAEEPLAFQCSCSRPRTAAALISLGETELRNIIAEQGEILMNCEFCHQAYQFTASDIDTLIAQGSSPVNH